MQKTKNKIEKNERESDRETDMNRAKKELMMELYYNETENFFFFCLIRERKITDRTK